MAKIRTLALGLVCIAALLPAMLAAQAYDNLDSGAGYHVTWHGWSDDGWVHWQNDCYASGCTGWYIVSAGW